MKPIRTIWYLFSPYVDAQERSVGHFFKHLDEHHNIEKTRRTLHTLLQQNIAVINLWTEYRYKGYRYLNKAKRRKLYANLELIAEDFDRYYKAQQPSSRTGIDEAKSAFLQALVAYFSPARGVYTYRESSSFGRLLRNPSEEKLVGDCNQIVTLYIYIYSKYYDVTDLQVRTLPNHVALHHTDIDIEATNGSFTNYEHTPDNHLLPVEEIVSINLLDVADSYLSTHAVSAKDMLQAARLAFILSYEREVVTQNLENSYGQLVAALMKQTKYTAALEIALVSRHKNLIHIAAHNGAVYELSHHNYSAVRRFAQHADDTDTLVHDSWHAEGIASYQSHRYHNAIKAFNHIHDQKLIQSCYEALFFEEQAKLGKHLSTANIKAHRKTIKRMQSYAKKSHNAQLIKHVQNLLSHI